MSTGMPKMRLVEVDWIDSCSSGGWASIEKYKARTPSICKTVGYLLERNKRHVIVVQNVADNGEVGESMTIPSACVKRLRGLK